MIEDNSGLQIQSKKAHHLELRLASLVGDECTGIINCMKHPRNDCHGDDSGARAALYHGFRLLGNLFRLQHVQSCSRNSKSKQSEQNGNSVAKSWPNAQVVELTGQRLDIMSG